MNRKETGMVMAILQAAFPAYYRNIKDGDASAAVNLWAEMFADDDVREVTAAVKLLIATQTQGYPPTIGAVKERISKLREPDRMTAQDAWALVSKAAAGNLEWEKLPPIVQSAIGSRNILQEWGRTEEEIFHTVIYSQFIKAFGIYDKRESEAQMVSGEMRVLLQGVADRMALPEGERDGKAIS